MGVDKTEYSTIREEIAVNQEILIHTQKVTLQLNLGRLYNGSFFTSVNHTMNISCSKHILTEQLTNPFFYIFYQF